MSIFREGRGAARQWLVTAAGVAAVVGGGVGMMGGGAPVHGLSAPCCAPARAGPPSCATLDPVLDSPAVQERMRELWWRAGYTAATPQADRREVGAWVIRDPDGAYRLELWDAAGSCRMMVPGAEPAGVVAFMHTHPWKVNEPVRSCGARVQPYRGMPSERDMQTAERRAQPGYILDADGIRHFGGPHTVVRSYDRCGY